MDYLIDIRAPAIDLALVREILQGLDAAAMVDLVGARTPATKPGRNGTATLAIAEPATPQHAVLRVSAALSVGDLLGLLEDAGLGVEERDIHRQPSVCCGGCGG